MSEDQIEMIRAMIEAGRTDAQIAFDMSGFEAERAAEDDEDRRMYGADDDLRSPSDAAYSDRLDMGRNDAGEWLGFM